MQNNLFYYATSELSQDAFICYLASFGLESGKKDAVLHECANSLMRLFVPDLEAGEIVIEKVERQINHIDVLLTVRDSKSIYKIIVEDKTFTSEHDNQLLRYMEFAEKEYPDAEIRGVYYKTGFQCDTEDVVKASYSIITREDILRFLGTFVTRTANQIVLDYYAYWSNFQTDAVAYKIKEPSQWDWKQIYSFFEFIQKETKLSQSKVWLGYDYVPNKTGGFYGLWTGVDDCRIKVNNAEYSLYLQIEAYLKDTTDYQICLKLCFEQGDNTSAEEIRSVRDQIVYNGEWKYKLTQYGFDKPKRIGSGKHMTIGVYPANCKDYITVEKSIVKAFSEYECLMNALKETYPL